MFSKNVEYSLTMLLYIYNNYIDKPIGANQILDNVDTPKNFSLKILQNLVRGRFIKSNKGKGGGFTISDDNFSIKDVIVYVDGKNPYEKCVIGLHECKDDRPCPLHKMMKDIKMKLYTDVLNKTIIEFCQGNDIRIYLK